MWDVDVRDATFANVVSDARRGLSGLLVDTDETWIPRTLTEELTLHPLVVTDAELTEHRLLAARAVPDPRWAIDVLRPVLELLTDAPFTGTDYLWPDSEGITSNLVLLAVDAMSELAGRALETADRELVLAATERGLRALPGHEGLISLRMRAHAVVGDLAGVRHEWACYERTLLADPWSDGEPAPELAALRAELLQRDAPVTPS